MKKIFIILVVGFLLLLGSEAGAQFATLLDSTDVAGWKFTTFTDVDDSLTAGYQIYQKIDSTDAVIDSAVGAERATGAGSADTTTAEFLHRSGGTMTGDITMPDDGWIGLGTAKIEFLDEAADSIRMWCFLRGYIGYFTFLSTISTMTVGNGLTVAAGSVSLPNDQINEGEIDWGAGAGQVQATLLPDFGTMTATDDNILVADGTDFESVVMSGDATINNGVMTVVDDSHAHIYSDIDATTSANWAGRVSDEEGTGKWVFGTSPTFTTDITSPLVIGGTATTSDLSFKTTSGVGESGADMYFLVGNNGATEAMTILNSGYVGIGTKAPNAPLEVRGVYPGSVGGFPSGMFHVTRSSNSEFANAVITGHNLFSGNTQLWYFGNSSGSNNELCLINRQDADLSFHTNSIKRMIITADGDVGIGDMSPAALLTVGDGDDFQVSTTGGVSTTGAVDFGGATSLEIPNEANPTTDVKGEIAYDTDDGAFELFDSVLNVSALIPVQKKFEALIWAPDGITDTIPLFYVDSTLYQGGIKIVSAELQTSVDGAYALNLYEFTAADPPLFSAHIDTLNVGATDQRVQSVTFFDSDIARGNIIYINTPATDIDWIRVSVRYYVKENN